MKRRISLSLFLLVVCGLSTTLGFLTSIPGHASDVAQTPKEIGLLPPVPIPADNPMTLEKIELGKFLFFDTRLSGDGSMACVTCHLPDQGWTTNTRLSPAYPSNKERRNSPTLINVAYDTSLIWDGRAPTLEKQALGPVKNPLHMNKNLDLLIQDLNIVPGYKKRFKKVFGTGITPAGISKALAAFQRTIVTSDSPFDEYMRGKKDAMSDAAIRGMAIYQGKGHCTLCHNGPNFTDQGFHNLGVPDPPYMKDPKVLASIRFDAQRMGIKDYRKLDRDLGRYLVTKDPADKGAFKTPTLRNVTQTGPYMHNGALETLLDVIDFYDRGGGESPNKSKLLEPLGLSKEEKADLIEFLKALTGNLPKVAKPDMSVLEH
jgi:cytochrome c peroxidase